MLSKDQISLIFLRLRIIILWMKVRFLIVMIPLKFKEPEWTTPNQRRLLYSLKVKGNHKMKMAYKINLFNKVLGLIPFNDVNKKNI